MDANAQFRALERLVMPGPLVQEHAVYEDQCESCHIQFDRQSQRQLCLGCHDEIAMDLATRSGFHSRSSEVGSKECAQCHTDHEGRQHDILGLDRATFDHDLTDFTLAGKHADVACDGCHEPNTMFHSAELECVSCHAGDDRHLGNLGADCAQCHSPTDWLDIEFDHRETVGYSLDGAHATTDCVGCHTNEQYEGTPTECVGCHLGDDQHMGTNGSECQDCHGTSDWALVLFDHFTATGFALAGGHSSVGCDACHTGNKFEQSPATECFGCHRDDDAHQGVNGQSCADCHRVTEWLDVTFDHARDTGFELHDAHAELDCASCHLVPVADALPATDCFGCHSDDDPHATQLGIDCGGCHGGRGFTVDVRFDHDLTSFPLLGRHEETDCASCHETHAFLDAPEHCLDCHADDDVHDDRLGADCAACHTPNDWSLWVFDHNTATDFVLDGAHANLDCLGCHREPLRGSAMSLSDSCGNCHRGDDVHDGEFGQDCARCHTTETFGALRAIR